MADADGTQAISTSGTTKFDYQPLNRGTNQIRLIKIGPHTDQESPHLDVETFELSDAPPFSALSYTWGVGQAGCRIYVNKEPFMVRDNLFRFLRAFRALSSEQTYIWIDQICIDQSNVLERNHQVHLMGRIYSMSESVIVWLGDASKSRLGKNYLDAAQNFSHAPNTHDLAVFLGDEYFERLWIIQEILLARTIRVLIKDVWITWDHILTTVNNNRVTLERLQVTPGTLSLLQISESPSLRPTKLESYLAEFTMNKCQDPLDKVYGFMGLVDEQHRLEIDYAKSVEQVYKDVASICNESLSHGLGRGHYPTQPHEYRRMLSDLAITMGIEITPAAANEKAAWFLGDHLKKQSSMACACSSCAFGGDDDECEYAKSRVSSYTPNEDIPNYTYGSRPASISWFRRMFRFGRLLKR